MRGVRLPRPLYDHVLVTGASSGLGLSFAEQLAPRARLLTLTARRGDRLEALAARLEAAHEVRCRVVPADLTAPGEVARLAAAVRGADLAVDVLVNNAGFGKHGGFDDFDWEDWDGLVRLNVLAATELLFRFWDELRAVPGRGAINVASLAGFMPIPWFAVYAASKAYLRSLSNGLSAEARASGTRVLSVCPGPTTTEFGRVSEADTSLTKHSMSSDEVVTLVLRAYAAGRREIVTGAKNRAMALLAPRLPSELILRVAAKVGRRERTPRRRSPPP